MLKLDFSMITIYVYTKQIVASASATRSPLMDRPREPFKMLYRETIIVLQSSVRG